MLAKIYENCYTFDKFPGCFHWFLTELNSEPCLEHVSVLMKFQCNDAPDHIYKYIVDQQTIDSPWQIIPADLKQKILTEKPDKIIIHDLPIKPLKISKESFESMTHLCNHSTLNNPLAIFIVGTNDHLSIYYDAKVDQVGQYKLVYANMKRILTSLDTNYTLYFICEGFMRGVSKIIEGSNTNYLTFIYTDLSLMNGKSVIKTIDDSAVTKCKIQYPDGKLFDNPSLYIVTESDFAHHIYNKREMYRSSMTILHLSAMYTMLDLLYDYKTFVASDVNPSTASIPNVEETSDDDDRIDKYLDEFDKAAVKSDKTTAALFVFELIMIARLKHVAVGELIVITHNIGDKLCVEYAKKILNGFIIVEFA